MVALLLVVVATVDVLPFFLIVDRFEAGSIGNGDDEDDNEFGTATNVLKSGGICYQCRD